MTTKYTTDAFATARFATHPDGRIAARIRPSDIAPWAVPAEPGDRPLFNSDSVMLLEGWSPLDETRLPRVVTDEMVMRACEDFSENTGIEVNDWAMRSMLTVALSVRGQSDAS